jgi:hypothetical protein
MSMELYYILEDWFFEIVGYFAFGTSVFWGLSKNLPKGLTSGVTTVFSKVASLVFNILILRFLGGLFSPVRKYGILLNRRAPKGIKDIEKVKKANERGKLFEEYCAEHLSWAGESFTTGELRAMKNMPISVMKQGGSGEQGVDVVVFLDKKHQKSLFNNKYEALLIQCKFYGKDISNKAVQEIVGAEKMYQDHFRKKFKLMVISNQKFTKPAHNLAKSNDVILVCGKTLGKWLK